MASEDNVRCVKYLYLLGNGGLEAERGIVIRETSNRSQSLENLLSENEFRFRRLPFVFGQLFTTNSEINADIGSWKMEVLFHVIKILFWKVLSPRERSAINTLHSYREDVDHSETSVMVNDYNTLRADVRTAIDDIAQGLCETRRLRLRQVVNITGSNDLDIQDTANQVRQLNEFPDELLESLENRFGDVVYPSNFSRSNTPFNFGERGATSRTFGGPKEPLNDDSNDTLIKTPFTDSSEQDPQDSQDDEQSDVTHLERRNPLRRVQENDAMLTERSANEDQRVNTILGKIKKLVRVQTSVNESREPFWESIDSKVEVESDTASNADAAQTELIRTINRIISGVNLSEVIRNAETTTPEHPPYAMERALYFPEFSEIVNDRIQAIELAVDIRGEQNVISFPDANDLSSLSEGNEAVSQGNSITRRLLPIIDIHIIEGSLPLLDNVLSLLIDIYQLGNEGEVHVMAAGQGCVEFMIRCRSYRGISNLLNFLKSDRFLDRLRGISEALEQQLRNRVRLHPYIPEGSLSDLEIFIAQELDCLPRLRSLSFQLKYGRIENLFRIKQYLKSAKAKEHLRNISNALSELHTGSTCLNTSLEPVQMKEALENRSDRLLYPTGNTSTVLHKTFIQNEDKKINDQDL